MNKDTLVQYLVTRIAFNPDIAIMIVADTNTNAAELRNKILKEKPLALIYAIGTGGITYGCRSDVIVLYNAFKAGEQGYKQTKWYLQEIRTRLSPKGEVFIITDTIEEPKANHERHILLVGGPRHGDIITINTAPAYYSSTTSSVEHKLYEEYSIKQSSDNKWYGLYKSKL